MAVTMVLTALALMAWPGLPPSLAGATGTVGFAPSGARSRDRARTGRLHPGVVRMVGPRLPRVVVVVVAGAIGGVVSWPCGVALAIVCSTGIRLVARARSAARARAELSAGTAALRALARELRAGAAGPAAVEQTARSKPPRVAAALRALTSTSSAADPPEPGSVLGEMARRLRSAGTVSAAHGVPLGSVVDALAGDLADRARTAEATAAQVAGPAVSGYVLAALPIAGLLLGAGMGTDPLGVLTGSGIGGALLVVGTLLCCAGLLWVDRIVRG